jgi:hypothetical protein
LSGTHHLQELLNVLAFSIKDRTATMSDDSFVWDGSDEGLLRLVAFHEAFPEAPCYCGKCGALLIVALSYEEANKLRMHTGIRCSKNPRHVGGMMEIGPRINLNEVVRIAAEKRGMAENVVRQDDVPPTSM